MPIASNDIQFRLSGGASNTSAAVSLGGAKSSTQAPSSRFDDVTSGEAAAADVEYRCIYVHNAHATLTLQGAVAWIQTNTPSANTSIAIGVGSSAVNGSEPAVANESTAPAGVTFTEPSTKAAGLALGNIPPGQHRAIWERRTVTAGASAGNDSYVVQVGGDTAA